MPESGTQWKDYSNYGNDGTLTGNATFEETGRRSQGVYFDGTGDYVDCGNDASMNIDTTWSVALWVKFKGIAATQTFFNAAIAGNVVRSVCMTIKQVEDEIQLGYTSVLQNKGAKFTTSGIEANKWCHIAFVYDVTNDTRAFYVNGKSLPIINTTGYYTPTGNIVSVGGRTTTLLMNGWIDECLMFNRLLTPSEVMDLYQQGVY
jgi:hypothetical protein